MRVYIILCILSFKLNKINETGCPHHPDFKFSQTKNHYLISITNTPRITFSKLSSISSSAKLENCSNFSIFSFLKFIRLLESIIVESFVISFNTVQIIMKFYNFIHFYTSLFFLYYIT